jgi:hypothetical protein
MAEQLDASCAVMDVTLNILERPYRARLNTNRRHQTTLPIFHADKMVRLSELKAKFGPIIEELKQQGKTNAATVSSERSITPIGFSRSSMIGPFSRTGISFPHLPGHLDERSSCSD